MTRPYVTNNYAYGFRSDLIDPIDSHTDYAVGGTVSTVASAGIFGENVVRQTMVSDASAPYCIITERDQNASLFKDGFFTINIRVSDRTKFNDVDIFLWVAPATLDVSFQYSENLGTGINGTVDGSGNYRFELGGDNEWIQLQWLGDNMATSGTFEANRIPIEKNHFRCQGSLAAPSQIGLTADFSTLRGQCTHAVPVVILSADDSNDTDYTQFFPLLQARGFHGVSYVITSIVGDSGRTTQAQYLEMQAARFDISTHGIDTIGANSLTDLTPAEQMDELEAARDAMIGFGFNSWRHYSFPEGEFNVGSMDALEALGYTTARNVNTAPYVLAPGFNLYHTRAFGLSQMTTNIGSGSAWSSGTTYTAGNVVQGTDSVYYTARTTPSTMSPNLNRDPANAQNPSYWLRQYEPMVGIRELDKLEILGGIQEFYVHRIQTTPTVASGHTEINAYTTFLDELKARVDAGRLIVVTKSELENEAYLPDTSSLFDSGPTGRFGNRFGSRF